jgi:ESS family glutamate:Na+ symporter
MNDFTPWSLLIDIGIISGLLLLGKLIRARVGFIQRLLIPPSLIAGFCGLIFGPEILGWLPLSSNMGTYASVLIALVFSTLPLTSQRAKGDNSGRVGRMWAYSQAGMLLQWALGGIMGMLVLSLFWKLNPAFGLSMSAGYCGGHGTAAAIGEAFAKYGFDDMQSLAMTAATVGIIASVVIGLWFIKWASNKGESSFLANFSELPQELKTGIIPKEKRTSMGEVSFSAISLDSMTFNFGTIALIGLGGYGLAQLIEFFLPGLMLPVFSCAFIVGLLVKWFYDKTKFSEYLSPATIHHLSGAFTDYLVAFGVASIKISVVLKFAVPLIILLVVGLVLTIVYIFYFGRRMHKTYWFEKALFTYGWFTGTMAMSIALLRIADPDSKSGCLDDYAFAYIYIAPVEICLITFSPLAFASGFGLLFIGICLFLGVGILALSRWKGWLGKPVSNVK